jgi:hypothetical protein
MGNSLFKNAVKATVGQTFQTLCAAPIGQASLLLQLNGSVIGTTDVVGTARIYDASQNTYSYLIKGAPIPRGDAIRLIDQSKIVLENGDRIEVLCGTTGETIDFIASLIEDINDDTGVAALGTYKNAIIPDVGNDWTTLYTAPADKTSFFLQINAANKSESGVQISVRLFSASEGAYVSILEGAQVPFADAIRLIDNAKIVVGPGDRIEVKCITPGEVVDLVGSLIEDVNQI